MGDIMTPSELAELAHRYERTAIDQADLDIRRLLRHLEALGGDLKLPTPVYALIALHTVDCDKGDACAMRVGTIIMDDAASSVAEEAAESVQKEIRLNLEVARLAKNASTSGRARLGAGFQLLIGLMEQAESGPEGRAAVQRMFLPGSR
jgi:hypothetical protein